MNVDANHAAADVSASSEARAADPAVAVREVGVVTSIQYAGLVRLGLRTAHIPSLIGMGTAVLIGCLVGSATASFQTGLSVGGVIAVLVMVQLLRGIRRQRREAMRRIRGIGEIIHLRGRQAAIEEVLAAVPWHGHDTPELVIGLAQSACLADCAGDTIYVSTDPQPIQPLEVPFEPQPLNEAESATMRLTARTDSPDATVEDNPHTSELSRKVRRNVALAGGWVAAIPLVIFWLMAAVDAMHQRKITMRLLFWTAISIATIFIPRRTKWSQQWLVVPGGVILRKTGWLKPAASLHLFDRIASVLCLVPQTKRMDQWIVAVADRESWAYTIATRLEADFLLRAWLSPVPPPPLERLSELQ